MTGNNNEARQCEVYQLHILYQYKDPKISYQETCFDLKSDIIVANIVRFHQNEPYLLLYILNTMHTLASASLIL